MKADALHEPQQDLFLPVPQQAQAVVTADALQHGPDGVCVHPLCPGHGGEDLRAAVAVLRVGVHHAAPQLHQLADVADEQRALKIQLLADIQRNANKIGHLHGGLGVDFQAVPDEIRTVVAGGQQHVVPLGSLLPQLHPNGVHQGLLAHGLHNAGGAENRDAAHDPQPGVEGLLRQLLSQGNGNFHGEAPGVIQLPGDFQQVLPDHGPGHRVDGRIAHALVKPRLGHPAHAEAAVNVHPGGRFQGDPGENQRTGGDVRVIPRVLGNGTGHKIRSPGDFLHMQRQIDPFGGVQADGFLLPARQQHPARRLGGCGGTGAGGVAQAQLLAVLYNKLFHYLVIW